MTDSILDAIEGIVHEPNQTEGRGVDLTLAGVFEVSEPGRVDFGGDELEPATVDPVATTKRNPGDDYEWWHLDRGQYLIEYNESIGKSTQVEFRLQTRDAVLARGGFHPTLSVEELDPVPFAVGGAGLKLKENARISTLLEG